MRVARFVLLTALLSALPAGSVFAQEPGSPEHQQRDLRNMQEAYGRNQAQASSPAFALAAREEFGEVLLGQLAQQAAAPGRPALTPGNVFPGWNGGNPLRRGWDGRRGLRVPIAYTNRYGALIRGNVFAPLPGARDPYTGERLTGPFPGIVITTGSVQGSERMYFWLAQDLAERGYVVMTYDLQGQGTSETFPHENEQANALPFCNPFAPPQAPEMSGCPGVPAQQASNFVYGTQDALSFFLATPQRPYKNRPASDVPVNAFNPLWERFDRSRDRSPTASGRTTRVGIIGHSLGAFAVSYVQGVDDRVQTAVALDKLGGGASSYPGIGQVKPVVPALGIQSEYGFTVNPYWANHGSSLTPRPASPSERPDPKRELATGFDLWRKAGVDSMVIVPRASTHLEYTDIAYVMPASRYGQALTSVYVQAWLGRYLKDAEPAVAPSKPRAKAKKPKAKKRKAKKRKAKARKRKRSRRARARHAAADPLLATSFRYLEPVAVGKWAPITLKRNELLSIYHCSGYALGGRTSSDISGVGGC